MVKRRKESIFSCVDSRILELAEKTLSESGISFEYAAANGVDVRDPTQSAELFKRIGQTPGPATLVFRYVTVSEKGVISPIPENEFLRFKPLIVGEGFAAQTTARQKYLQIGAGSHLYIPTVTYNLEIIDWAEVLRAEESIRITEGEKKALSAMYRGLLTVSLGGKDNFRVSKHDKTLLPDLRTLTNKRRTYITFDSDKGSAGYKPEVSRSANNLARELVANGSEVLITILPSKIDEKIGLDDWLVKNDRILREEVPIELEKYSYSNATAAHLLEELNTLVYVSKQNAVADLKTRDLTPLSNYLEDKGNIQVVVNELKFVKDDALKTTVLRSVPKVTTLARAFMTALSRPTVKNVDLYPGNYDPIAEGNLNIWPGWAQKFPDVSATKKDVEPFFEFLEGLHEEDAEYMANWYLYPLKFPGVKLFTVPVLKHPKEGTGKSTMGELLGEYIYGKEMWTIVGADKLNKLNFKVELVGGKLFSLIDDADDVELSSTLSALKGIVTQKYITVVYKYMNKATIRNYVNTGVTTNRERPFPVAKFDRRLHYPKVTEKYWTPSEAPLHPIFAKLHKWFEEGGGGKLVSYAIHNHDFKSFNPYAPAPMGSEKMMQISLSETPLQEVVKRLLDTSDEYVREVFTFSEIKLLVGSMLSVDHDNYKFNYSQLAAALREEGVLCLGVTPVGKTTYSIYALKNMDRWRLASKTDIEKELAKEVVKKEASKELKARRVKEEKQKAEIIDLAKRLNQKGRKY